MSKSKTCRTTDKVYFSITHNAKLSVKEEVLRQLMKEINLNTDNSEYSQRGVSINDSKQKK